MVMNRMTERLHKNRHGFTLMETLLVIALLAVLLAVSVVGVLAYRRQMQIAELDAAAREIYMAAQNRAVLLHNSQRLEALAVREDGSNSLDGVFAIPGDSDSGEVTAYYVHMDEAAGDLLPAEAVEPALWDGDFYIVYEPESASVMDVFFTWTELPVNGGFAAFYDSWRGVARALRMNSDPMIGYYGSSSGESGSTESLLAPIIEIGEDENVLRVTVTYLVRQDIYAQAGSSIRLDVDLTYEGKRLQLAKGVAGTPAQSSNTPGYRAFTWTSPVLDDPLGLSGERAADGGVLTFREKLGLGEDNRSLGGDFTVTARVYCTDSGKGITPISGAREGNTLFASGTTADTAAVRCLRNLQNLEPTVSGVRERVTGARQQNRVDYPLADEEGGRYDAPFRPISNGSLTFYDGDGHEIYGLNVESDGDAGLFGTLTGTADNPIQLTGIRLVNTSVTASGGSAGALAGSAARVRIDDCLVYWEDTDEADLVSLLTRPEGETRLPVYQITGGTAAGGLVGALTDAAITGSAAATLAEGPTVGGLAGTARDVAVTGSYADCYLSGTAAGGLFGAVSGGSTVDGSYAVGFLETPGEGSAAGGLYPASGSAAVATSYCAVEIDGGMTCQAYDGSGTMKSANTMLLSDPGEWEDLFGGNAGGTFAAKSAATSHPYNLMTEMALSIYPYPGLPGLEHWGDWSAAFSDGALAYYEYYGGEQYGFMGGGYNTLRSDRLPVDDGYAVVFRDSGSVPDGLGVEYQTAQAAGTDAGWTAGTTARRVSCTVMMATGEGTAAEPVDIVLLPLPDGAVNSDYTTADFYQQIRVENGDGTYADYYYNPHFAVIPAEISREEGASTEKPDARGMTVFVRIPRHLYHLSAHADYFNSGNQYRFTQQLDLDYTAYAGAVTSGGGTFDTSAGWYAQTPIGRLDAPFRCSYNGGGHVITGVLPQAGGDHVGLFGYSAGTLRNIVYRMTGTLSVEAAGTTRHVGGLTGFNAGTVDNCAVCGAAVSAKASGSGAVYLGGLAGQNQGNIRRSAVEGADLTLSTNLASGWGGGLTGWNTGTADQCYAVGSLTAVQEQPTDRLTAAGFSGGGGGEASRGYAAVNLVTGRGEPAIHGFGSAARTSRDCLYLNNGVFTYRSESFTALYEDTSGADPASWPELTGETPSAAVDALGMDWGARAVDGNPGENGGTQEVYPLPAAVTDGQGGPVHYGQWPERVPLGGMGVFYWEKLGDTYHLSAIAADLEGGTIRKLSTLSTAHDDGKTVTEYGYGYYASEGLSVAAGSRNISWTRSGSSGDFNFTQPENTGANQALGELIKGYIFRCFDTIDPERGGEHEDGLYCTATDIPENDVTARDNAMARPGGAWTLSVGGYTLTVDLDPFFADAMSLSGQSGFATVEGALNVGLGNAQNPYQVRSIDQLRLINWNAETKNCSTVLTGTVDDFGILGKYNDNQTEVFKFGTHDAFPYLSYGRTLWEYSGRLVKSWSSVGEEAYDRPYHWRQSHDIHGGGATYSPIAELYDTTSGRSDGVMHGWFGGTYNGDSYMIEEVNIQGGDSSCAGLFGAVANGKLENITLYSEHGAAVRSRDGENGSVWYAIGGLAGVAAAGEGSAIENCAVAGYQIIDTHEGGATWGGTSQGGLIGMSSMNLTGCTAVTQVTYDATDYDNERVGGLVGSCHGTITNCYAGGSIAVTGSSGNYPFHGIYVGGLAGGTYMKQLRVPGHYNFGGNEKNSFINCYSYVRLPNEGSSSYLSDLYAVAGEGDGSGSTAHQNCYYLREIVLADNNGNDRVLTAQNGVNGVTYDQLSAGGAAYNSLLGEFQPVTALDGRFSFPGPEDPANPVEGETRRYTGLDYPFPAILTQPSDLAENNTAYVHYGWWPLNGIVRADGHEAVQLDLFTDEPRQIALSLSDDLAAAPSGVWTAAAADPEVVSAVLAHPDAARPDNTLTLTPLRPGETTVTVACAGYGSLEVRVIVTAELTLVPTAPITLAPGGTVPNALLTWADGAGTPLDAGEAALIQVIGGFTASYDPDGLAFAQVTQTVAGPVLEVTAGAQPGSVPIIVSYSFTYNGSAAVDAASSITVEVQAPSGP